MSQSSNESYCSFTLPSDLTTGGLPSEADICLSLESNTAHVKRGALKAAIMSMLGGESLPRVLMQVIRYCINTQDHQLKKLMMLYWEVVPKYQPRAVGQKGPNVLLPEMILVCNALMNDLNHPNEYVRGSMLRFLCKIDSSEILGPLMESIKANLEHRHHYVRKNAALCFFHIHRLHGDTLLPDGPDMIRTFIAAETDTAARRNAFLMLINQSQADATDFLAKVGDSEAGADAVEEYGAGFQLLVLDLTRRVCRVDPSQKGRFVRLIFQMLNSPDSGVSYEAAWTLCSLSTSPSAIRAAATTYTSLLNNVTDASVKLIVLDRLSELKLKHGSVLQEVLMDVLRALSSPSLDICRKVLDVAMDLVSGRNVDSVVNLLKREVLKTKDSDLEKGSSYRTMLIQSIHVCATKYPEVAGGIAGNLMEFLSHDGGIDVIIFVRAIVEQYADLRDSILSDLVRHFDTITNSNVMGIALWILSEYGDTMLDTDVAFNTIMENLGDAPYVRSAKEEDSAKKVDDAPKVVTKNVVLADGTYATQTVYNEPDVVKEEVMANLRKMIVDGDIFLGSVLASSLTKLCLKSSGSSSNKGMTVKSLLALCGIAKMSSMNVNVTSQKSSTDDCHARLSLCIRVLLDPHTNKLLRESWITSGRITFGELLKEIKSASTLGGEASNVAPDDLIHIRQLKANTAVGGDIDLDDGSDLIRAIGSSDDSNSNAMDWKHVYQLSGFADPIYAEAMLQVNDYDIKLEILCINRTPESLITSIELNTMGDMKLVERPQTKVIGPLDQTIIKASIKVSSTESGHLFGTIVHENAETGVKGYINLNDIHMDIMDYIRPATCTDEAFRSMWAEFEWENKVAISTSITSLPEFLEHIVANTNMSCLTPYDKTGSSMFLACNLHARSVFGEDALVNVSVEKKNDKAGKLAGYIRIRSKTQGIALSLGDRITSIQRKHDEEAEAAQEGGGEERAGEAVQ
jgi:coatomer subunit beta